VNATQLNVADLKRIAGIDQSVTGTLSANLSLHGSQLNPIGRGTISLTQATVAGEPIQSANVDFQGTGDEVRARLGLRMPAGSAQSTVTYFPKRKAYDGEFQATGIRLDQFKTLRERNLNMTGTLNITAKGSGTVDNPGLQFTAQIPQLQIQDQRIDGITLEAGIQNRVATATLDSQSRSLNAVVRGRGRVNLSGDYAADALFDTSAIPLQPLIAAYWPAQSANLSGQTEVHATLKGPLKNIEQIDAHLTIPTLSVAYTDKIKVAAAQPIQLDYSRGVLTLQKTAIKGTGTDLQLQGTIPVTGNAPISLVALGTVDLALAQMMDPDITSSGQVQFNIDGRGGRSDPTVQGQIKIVNAALAGDSLPLGMQNGNGVLTLTNNRLEVTKFQGNISGGTLTATGAVAYRPSIQFNLSVAANGIRTLYPQGVREGIDTNLALVGSPENATLRGQVRLTELSFSPTFDLDDIAAVAGAPAGATAPPGSFARNLHLNISVISTNDLNLASSKLSLQGAANLRVNGTAAEPAILGRVNVSDGDLIYRGNRYFLEQSTLDFVDPFKIDPRVNLRVSTKVQDYDIHMLFRGTLDKLRTTYTSEPALPPSDIINLLVFGKTNEAAAANPTPGNLGAESAIASSVSSQVTSRLEKVAGISQLSVDPVLGGNQQDPGARITIQQRVTGSLFVTFATDATSTQRQVIKLDYQATPRVGISGVRDQNGGFAFDVRVKKSW
jgi:translocation and assembly module TamB